MPISKTEFQNGVVKEIGKTRDRKCLPRFEIGNAFVKERKLSERLLLVAGHVSSLSCHVGLRLRLDVTLS